MSAISECAWCAKPISSNGRGRPKVYCSHACRQRAYEARKRFSGISDRQTRYLLDTLFELRSQAEDIATAVGEGANYEELNILCRELTQTARRIETHPSIVKLMEKES